MNAFRLLPLLLLLSFGPATAQDVAALQWEWASRVNSPSATRPLPVRGLRYHAPDLFRWQDVPLRLDAYAVDARSGHPGPRLLTELVILCQEEQTDWRFLDLHALGLELPPTGVYLTLTPVFGSDKFYCWPLAAGPVAGQALPLTGPYWRRRSTGTGWPADSVWQSQTAPLPSRIELLVAAP